MNAPWGLRAGPGIAEWRRSRLRASELTDAGKQVFAWALVQEGTGFRAAIVRSVVSGLLLLSRRPYAFKSFATVADGRLAHQSSSG